MVSSGRLVEITTSELLPRPFMPWKAGEGDPQPLGDQTEAGPCSAFKSSQPVSLWWLHQQPWESPHEPVILVGPPCACRLSASPRCHISSGSVGNGQKGRPGAVHPPVSTSSPPPFQSCLETCLLEPQARSQILASSEAEPRCDLG